MKLILLSKGKSAKVDDELFDFLNQWKWHFDGEYARRNENGKHVYLHKVVFGAKDGEKVDHKDLDQLNDQRVNLRICTSQTNAVNSRKAPNKSSIYKGVSKSGKQWRTQIWFNNKRHFDTAFPNERWAAIAYDLNAAALFG